MNALPRIEQLAQEFKNESVAILGMCTNYKDEDARFVAQKLQLTFPILMASQDLAGKYRVDTTPTIVVIDKVGKICMFSVGDSPTVPQELGAAIRKILAKR
jgi:thioredoxin-related protein